MKKPVSQGRELLGVSSQASSLKPLGCQQCPLTRTSRGFCPDWSADWVDGKFSKLPLLMALLEAAGKDEIVYREPLTGPTGVYWEHSILASVGLKRSDLLISNVLRCQPSKLNEYPNFPLRRPAEITCRQYDEKAIIYNPEVFVVSLHPAAVFRNIASHGLISSALRRALKLRESYRVCILFGDKALGLIRPDLAKLGVSKIHGHWFHDVFPGARGKHETEEKTT